MSFANPAWFWAFLLLLPAIALRVWNHLKGQKRLSGLVAPRLHRQLVSGSSQLMQWLVSCFILLGLSGVILALARPQWGYEEVNSFSEGRSIMLAIDTSRSMLATDLVPDRLSRAKLAARDIVDGLQEDRIGLIAFAGRAFLQAPLTTDHQAIIESIDQVDTDLIPRGGTNLTAAASLAISSFKEAESQHNALILFSDGEALEGQSELEQIKEEAKRVNMVIITIGVGTENGSIIPEPGPDGRPQEGVFIKDAEGQVVRSRLDPTALQSLATGGGVYIQLGDRGTLTRVVQTIAQNLETTREEDETQKRPIERFMWPLSFGVLLLVLSHLVPLLFAVGRKNTRQSLVPSSGKTGIITGSAALVLLLSNVTASEGWRLVEKENYVSALKKFEEELSAEELSERKRTSLHLGVGTAAYRLKNYEQAAMAYGKALIQPRKRTREQAHYNLGNTLFRKGETILNPSSGDQNSPEPMSFDAKRVDSTLRQWLGAIEHYEAALEINENNADAQHNLELLKEKIKELKQQQPPPPEQQEQEDQQQEQQDQDQQQEQNDQQEDDQNNQSQQQQNQNQQQQQDDQQQQQENQEDSSDGSSDQKDQQQDSGGDSQDQSQQPENSDQNEGSENSQQEDPQQGEQEGNQEEPTSPPDPGDGEIQADGNQTPPSSESGEQQRAEAMNQTNPDTGYSPSEARQLIEALADEDGDLRPVYPRPYRQERYQNW